MAAEGEEMDSSTANIGARVFADALIGQVRKKDVTSMVQHQRDMLSRFEKTNEMLINFNMLSSSRFETTSREFRGHTQLLYDMKKDLDTVFRRIRKLKGRLSKMHPEAFAEETEHDEQKSETLGAISTPQAEGEVLPKTEVKVTPTGVVTVSPKVDVNNPSIQS